MNIQPQEITVCELAKGYADNGEEGVVGYDGRLDIRPKYQREFIYGEKEREAVINTVRKNFPLNVMYWAVRTDGNYEVIDGQQRTISLCQYVIGKFPHKNLFFGNLQEDHRQQILDYKLMVYLCSGSDSEKLDWFTTINIAGKKLYQQELRNAVYAGSWTANAKLYFSKNECAAHGLAYYYLDGLCNRQDYLKTAIDWISEGKIEAYMAEHQHDANAAALWRYFQDVITWAQTTFTTPRKIMKGRPWGRLYNQYKDEVYDTKAIELETAQLIADDDVEKKSGIYEYILSRDQRHLDIRAFSDSIKQKVYEQQEGVCPHCKEEFEIGEMEGDHITPWCDGGRTIEDNCQMLCKEDNRRKAGK